MKVIKKQSIVDMAADQITEYLASDKVQNGDKLPTEFEMCEKLNVSRATLREVYRKLQSQGYLELKPGRGAFVKNKEADLVQQAINWFRNHDAQMQSYLEVRLYLDPLASKLAAQNRTTNDILVLKQIQFEFEKSYNEKDNERMAKLDADFHKAIVDISNNELLLALIKIINYYFEQLRMTSFKLEEHASHAIDPHRKIIEAIEAGDVKKAEEASVEHMKIALYDLCGENNIASL
jgi:GntR family transcriptional repressor for pyruvate dehydrogenase complex